MAELGCLKDGKFQNLEYVGGLTLREGINVVVGDQKLSNLVTNDHITRGGHSISGQLSASGASFRHLYVSGSVNAEGLYVREVATLSGDLNASNASMTYLNASNASIDRLNASNASMTHLNASNASVTYLNASNASMTYLNASHARIISLNATNDQLLNLTVVQQVVSSDLTCKLFIASRGTKSNYAGSLHANNASITHHLNVSNASMTKLNASNASLTHLNASNASITHLYATNASITHSLRVTNASMTQLFAPNASMCVLHVENKAVMTHLNASNATMTQLNASESHHASNASLTHLNATNASLTHLNASNASLSQLNASHARITRLNASHASIDRLNASNASMTCLNASNASMTHLNASNASITHSLRAINASITHSLRAINASMTYLYATNASITHHLNATNASITHHLNASNASMTHLYATNASITHHLNASNASMTKLFASNASMTKLYATNASIARLNVSMPLSLTKLNASNASMTKLYATKASIALLNLPAFTFKTHLNASNASMVKLSADVCALTKLNVSGSSTIRDLNVSGSTTLHNYRGVRPTMSASNLSASYLSIWKWDHDDTATPGEQANFEKAMKSGYYYGGRGWEAWATAHFWANSELMPDSIPPSFVCANLQKYNARYLNGYCKAPNGSYQGGEESNYEDSEWYGYGHRREDPEGWGEGRWGSLGSSEPWRSSSTRSPLYLSASQSGTTIVLNKSPVDIQLPPSETGLEYFFIFDESSASNVDVTISSKYGTTDGTGTLGLPTQDADYNGFGGALVKYNSDDGTLEAEAIRYERPVPEVLKYTTGRPPVWIDERLDGRNASHSWRRPQWVPPTLYFDGRIRGGAPGSYIHIIGLGAGGVAARPGHDWFVTGTVLCQFKRLKDGVARAIQEPYKTYPLYSGGTGRWGSVNNTAPSDYTYVPESNHETVLTTETIKNSTISSVARFYPPEHAYL